MVEFVVGNGHESRSERTVAAGEFTVLELVAT